MKVRVQVVIEAEGEAPEVVRDIARWERGRLRPEALGLNLTEAKGLLEGIQQTMVTWQAEEYIAQHRHCPHCGRPRTHKGQHPIVFRTLFGKLTLESPRLYACRCKQAQTGKSLSPLADLLNERTAPELAYSSGEIRRPHVLRTHGRSLERSASARP
jgi:hypothetical protein